MTDLRDLLHDASAGVRHAPASASVEADLRRGRRGLRRRRILRGAGSGVAAAAVVGVAVVVIQSGLPPAAGPSVPASPAVAQPAPPVVQLHPEPPPSAPAELRGVALVSYEGDQPVGFVIDKVPEGWEVQGADTGVLTLAPIGATDRDINSFVGKIAVTQGDQLPDGLTPTEVAVGDADGLVFRMKGGEDGEDGGKTLFVRQPSGDYLVIQTPPELGWADEELAEFGAGIHVTDDAVTSVG
jgi:hypothetical protein